MPLQIIDVDRARRVVRSVASGAFSVEDLRAHLAWKRQEALLDCADLVEANELSASLLTPAVVRELAAAVRLVADVTTLGPVALVAADNAIFGMLRMYEMLTDGVLQVHIVRRTADALAWLDELGEAP